MTPAEQALCSVHPSVPAQVTCGRCGRFACDACLAPGDSHWCVSCEGDRWGEWNRGPYTIGTVLEQGVALFGRNAHVALLLAVMNAAVETVLSAADLNFLPVLLGVEELFMDALLSAAFILCLHAHVQGRPVIAKDVISGAVLAFPRVLLASVLAGLLMVLGFVACVVPGLLAMAQLSLCQVIAVLEPGKGPISTSFTTVHGRLLAVPAVIAIGAFAAFGGLAFANQLLTLYVTHGAGVQLVSLVGGISHGLVSHLADALLFCVWVRLRHPQHSVA